MFAARCTVPSLVALVVVQAATAAQTPRQLSSHDAGVLAARSLLAAPARLEIRSAALNKALSQLRATSGVAIAFSDNLLPAAVRRTCDCADRTVGEALGVLLRDTGLRFSVVGSQVLIEPVPQIQPSQTEPSSLAEPIHLASASSVTSLGAAISRVVDRPLVAVVAGQVVDERAQPIAGATVMLVNGTARATTNATGRFSLEVPDRSGQSIRVTAIGYRPHVEPIPSGSTSDLRIVLTQVVINLDEVVVTGTPGGTQKRALGTAVGQIRAAEVVELAPVTDVGQLMTSRIPGVSVRARQGYAGAGPQFTVRGTSTFSLNDQPLIYVDGVRVDNRANTGPITRGSSGFMSRMNDVNPEDIEQIEVIKGPAAATLYGTEAANGVIQIITKRGKAGDRPVLELAVRQGYSALANPEGWFPDAYQVINGELRTLNLIRQESERGTPFFRTGHNQGYNLNASGGTSTLQYYLGGEFDRDEGVLPGNDARRLGARVNLTITPSDKFTASTNFFLASGHTAIGDPFNSVLFNLWSGVPSLAETPRRGFFTAPPEVINALQEAWQSTDRFTVSTQMTHRPNRWLSHRVSVGLDLTNEEDVNFRRQASPEQAVFFTPLIASGGKFLNRQRVSNITLDYAATGTVSLSNSLSSSTSAGLQHYRNRYANVYAEGVGFPSAVLQTISAAATKQGSESYVENASVGVFLQEQLSWKDRLFLTGAIRVDNNSAFGSDFDFVTYPKASLSWVVSEEPFWGGSLVNQLKLRAAYGASGQQPQTFAAIRTYNPTSRGDGSSTVTPGAVGNPLLGPERGAELELGFEAGLLNDRLSLDFTYYNRQTKDAILSRPVAPSGGFTTDQFVNVGRIDNWGLELLATARLIQKRSLTFDLTANASTNKNEIVDLGGPEIISLDDVYQHRVGYPVYGMFHRRIVQAEHGANGITTNVLCDGGPGAAPVPCATAPRVYFGSAASKWEGSLTSTVTLFGRLTAFATLETRRGARLMDGDRIGRCSVRIACLENHRPLETDPITAAYLQSSGIPWGLYNSDATFTRLREISLTWGLPASTARWFGASRALVSASARNVALWQRLWSGDPEVTYGAAYSGSSAQVPSTTNKDRIPMPVQFVGSIRVTF
ncbi:MAG: SusC/RagA family TonB-linked outer membrane protein [Gemmatimonadales bacterium]|nr:SusC/RagA family TonB-linked outer membrane protein [Gemmatimonadales bacterium]